MKIWKLSLLMSISLYSFSATAALIGTIEDVLIDGAYYDASIYDNFSETDGVFYDQGFALAASAALRVILNGDLLTYAPGGVFTAPACSTGASDCIFMTFYNLQQAETALYINGLDAYVNGSAAGIIAMDDFLGFSTVQWTGAQVVPVPPAIWLMGSGLAGLLSFGRRNKMQT